MVHHESPTRRRKITISSSATLQFIEVVAAATGVESTLSIGSMSPGQTGTSAKDKARRLELDRTAQWYFLDQQHTNHRNDGHGRGRQKYDARGLTIGSFND